MPAKKFEWTFGCDDAENDGPQVEQPWGVERDAEGLVWIGGTPIGWADTVSVVQSLTPDLLTITFTVRADEVSFDGLPTAPAPPVHVDNCKVHHRTTVFCICGHPVDSHKHTGIGIDPGLIGGTRCTGTGLGPCECRQFIARNLCKCGHTAQVHSSWLGKKCLCRTFDPFLSCTCIGYQEVPFHESLVF